jgi:beta-mannosidase
VAAITRTSAAWVRLLLPRFKDLSWPAPRIDVRVEQGSAIFRSDVFVWGVCLDLDGDTPLEDNFFDVFPGMEHAIAWPYQEGPRVRFSGNMPGDSPRRSTHGN